MNWTRCELSSDEGNGRFGNVMAVLIPIMMLLLCALNGGQVFKSAGPQVAIGSSVVLLMCGIFHLWRRGGFYFSSAGLILVLWLCYMTVNVFLWGQDSGLGKILQSVLLSAGVLSYCCYGLKTESLKVLYSGLIVVGFILACIALFQFFVDPSWHPVSGRVKAQYGGRVSSLFGQPNSFAIFMLILLPYPLLQFFKKKVGKVAYGTLAILFMWCLLASVSRAVTLVAFPVLAMVAFFAVEKWRSKCLTFASLVGVMAVLYSLNSFFSVTAGERFSALAGIGGEVVRKEFYAIAIELFTQRPVLGVGVGNFQTLADTQFPMWIRNNEYFVHSDYLQILCETGLVGLGLLLGGLVLLVLRVVKGGAREANSVYSQVALCGLLGFALHEVVDLGLQMASVLFIVAIYLGVLMRQSSGHWRVSLNWAGRLSSIFILGALMCAFLVVFLPISASNLKSAKAWGFASYVYAYLDAGQPVSESNIQGVIALFDEAIEQDPDNLLAYWGKARHLQSYRFKENIDMKKVVDVSVATFDLAIERSPNRWHLWAERGVSLELDKERVAEAKASYLKAIELAPMHAEAWKYYAEFLAGQGDEKAYRDALEQVLLLGQSHGPSEWAIEALVELDSEGMGGL